MHTGSVQKKAGSRFHEQIRDREFAVRAADNIKLSNEAMTWPRKQSYFIDKWALRIFLTPR